MPTHVLPDCTIGAAGRSPAISWREFRFEVSKLANSKAPGKLLMRPIGIRRRRLPGFKACPSSLKSMAITEKTRKILWARSGNRCAICRHRLVIDETKVDSESIVGDECHIHSGKPLGPRHNTSIDAAKIDDYSNLLILCRIHHKMIDDQPEHYTAEKLRDLKASHESWVERKFDERSTLPQIRIRRIKKEEEQLLKEVDTGPELINLLLKCSALSHSYPADIKENEVELVGGFIQQVKDYMDISSVLEPLDQMRSSMDLNRELIVIKSNGFFVFAGLETQRCELDNGSEKYFDLIMLHLTIVRKGDQRIVLSKSS